MTPYTTFLTFLVLLACATHTASSCDLPHTLPPICLEPKFDAGFRLTRRHMRDFLKDVQKLFVPNPALVPAFLRLAFHDCIAATPDRPLSGCNGSIRLAKELAHPDNARLDVAVTALQPLVAAYECVGWADAVLIAARAALRKAGVRVAAMVDPREPRRDADDADDAEAGLPKKDWPIEKITAHFSARGFSPREFTAGLVAGHSIGGATGPDAVVRPFTPFSTRVNEQAAVNLVFRHQFARSYNTPGFHPLQADFAYIADAAGPDAPKLLHPYAGWRDGDFHVREGRSNLKKDMELFMIKLSKLKGSDVRA